LIAVFFADQAMELSLLQKLKSIGIYGAMLDTKNKQQNLLEICTLPTLKMFTQVCQKTGLRSGLAGSLKSQHIGQLADINPTYIGFRGGACANDSRTNGLIHHKILNIKNMLHEHNKFNGLAQQAWVSVA
jgi:(5-formylfuran-3-yl)methyl phosphate synthase